MAAEVEREIMPAGVWDGAFTWDGYFLRVHIKTVKTSYDRNDPRTWPLIKDVLQPENNKHYRKIKIIPAFLAYDQSLMENLVNQPPVQRTKDHLVINSMAAKICIRFHDYPFNFDKKGQLRTYPHIPPSELRDWMMLMMGTTLDAKGSLRVSQAVTTAQQEPNLSTNISPRSAYGNIMKNLTDTKASSPAAMAELQEELGNVKALYHKEEARADKAEGTIRTLNEQIVDKVARWRGKVEAIAEKLRNEKACSRAAIAEEKEQTRAARDRLVVYENQLKESNDELGIARKEVLEANERIITVWENMQKAQAATTRKRRAKDEASEPHDGTGPVARRTSQCESDVRSPNLLTTKLEDKNNELMGLKRSYQAMEEALDNTKVKLTEAKAREETAERDCRGLKQRVDQVQKERENTHLQLSRFRRLCLELKGKIERLEGANPSNADVAAKRLTRFTGKRARCESVVDEYFDKASKRAKQD